MAELAELISAKDKTTIERFIRCVRKALWFDILRYQLGLGLWKSSLILILAGVINLFFRNMLISLSLTLALLPIVGGIIVAIKKMPTIANAACHADDLFNGKSLMTTATELIFTNPAASRDFSPWIIQQAALTAQLWHEQFKQAAYHKQNQFPWTALVIALFGVFLILLPGVRDKQKVTTVESNRLTPHSKPALIASLINEIRREENALQDGALSSKEELTEDFLTAGKQALSQLQPNKIKARMNDMSSNINKDNLQTSMEGPSQGGFKTGNSQLQPQNQRADAGIGTQADDNPSSSLHKDDQNLDIKLVNIELQDGTLVSSNSKGLPFKAHQFSGSDKRNKVPSTLASGNTSIAYTTRFSPSQQQYINAYFKNILMEK